MGRILHILSKNSQNDHSHLDKKNKEKKTSHIETNVLRVIPRAIALFGIGKTQGAQEQMLQIRERTAHGNPFP